MDQEPISVAVIHGMGTHPPPRSPDGSRPGFSAPLRWNVRDIIGHKRFDARVHWREIDWSDLIQPDQDALEARIGDVTRMGWTRHFVLSYLGDAANFQHATKATSFYQRVHTRIRERLAALDQAAGGTGPLLIVAHSLGGHMISTWLWDNNRDAHAGEAPVAAQPPIDRLRGLLTFGCNIPVFAFVHQNIKSIDARRFATAGHLLPTWWRNLYARADPLGYPLAPTGGGYTALAQDYPPQLTDTEIWPSLAPWVSLTPLSHTAYWSSDRVARELVAMMD